MENSNFYLMMIVGIVGEIKRGHGYVDVKAESARSLAAEIEIWYIAFSSTKAVSTIRSLMTQIRDVLLALQSIPKPPQGL